MDKVMSLLSLSRKAGKLTVGTDATLHAVKSGKAKCVLVTKDLSQKSRKNITFACDERQTRLKELPYTMEEMEFWLGKRFGIMSVMDDGFCKGICDMLENENGEERSV